MASKQLKRRSLGRSGLRDTRVTCSIDLAQGKLAKETYGLTIDIGRASTARRCTPSFSGSQKTMLAAHVVDYPQTRQSKQPGAKWLAPLIAHTLPVDLNKGLHDQ